MKLIQVLIILFLTILYVEDVFCANQENPYKDGTTRVKLTATEKENLLKFINDSKYQLEKALEDANGKTFDEANRVYHEIILKVVMESYKYKRRAELLMRYALNQALELTYGEPSIDGKTLEKEGVLKDLANQDLLTVILEDSIKLAIKYYDLDKIAVDEMSLVNLPFIKFSYTKLYLAKEWLTSIFEYDVLLNFEIAILEQWVSTVKNDQTLEDASIGHLIYEVDKALDRVQKETYTVVRKSEYLKGIIFKLLKGYKIDKKTTTIVRPKNNTTPLGACKNANDNSQYYIAKDFAEKFFGYTPTKANSWAIDYFKTHDCNSIDDYIARFRALYMLAYSTDYMNLNIKQSLSFALSRIETWTSYEEIKEAQNVFIHLKELVYSSDFLNKDKTEFMEISIKWIDRRNCGGLDLIVKIKDHFERNFNYAKYDSGLALSSSNAKMYAIEKIKYLSPSCIELLR